MLALLTASNFPISSEVYAFFAVLVIACGNLHEKFIVRRSIFLVCLVNILLVLCAQFINARPLLPTLEVLFYLSIVFGITNYAASPNVSLAEDVLRKYFAILPIIIVIHILAEPFTEKDVGFSGVFASSNNAGMAMAINYMLCRTAGSSKFGRHVQFVLCAVLLGLLVLSASRAAMLTIIFFELSVITFAILGNAGRHWIIIGLVVSSAMVVGFFLGSSFLLAMLEVPALLISNKPLDTGRFTLFAEIVRYFSLFGVGLDDPTRSILGLNTSAHSLYLHLILGGGPFYLCFFVVSFVLFLYKRQAIQDSRIRNLLCFLASLLFLENFELSLVANNLPRGTVFWLALGWYLNANTFRQRAT